MTTDKKWVYYAVLTTLFLGLAVLILSSAYIIPIPKWVPQILNGMMYVGLGLTIFKEDKKIKKVFLFAGTVFIILGVLSLSV